MLLIHPPIAKPCEPPAGISKLAGALRHHHIRCRVWDACIEGYDYLLNLPQGKQDTFTNRAYTHRFKHAKLLRSDLGYQDIEIYKQTIKSLDRVMMTAGADFGVRVSFANYTDERLSPLNSSDLVDAATHPEKHFFYSFFKGRLTTLYDEEPFDVAGISMNYLNQALGTFAIAGILREILPDVRIVIGGGLVTSWLQRPDWENPFSEIVDHFVSGPGEIKLLEYLGIQAEENNFTPDFSGLPLKDYFAPGLVLPYSASSGCYWAKCDFCPEKAEKNGYVPVPENQVVSDLRQLNSMLSPKMIHFLDNSFSPRLMNALISEPPGIPWYGFTRFTTHFTDEGFCEKLKQSGCAMLQLGLESGDQNVLFTMNKGLDLGLASRSLKMLHKKGIGTYVYLLFGTPGETLSEARNTLRFVADHHQYIDFLNLAIFNLPVFSPDAASLDTGHFYDGDLSLYMDFKHPKGWDRFLVRKFLDKEFRKHRDIAPIIKKDPPVFNSNHAPFFLKNL